MFDDFLFKCVGPKPPKIELQSGLGLHWEVLEATWGLLGRSWRHLGRSWRHLGRLGEVLGASWVELGASWVELGASWVELGASWWRFGAILGRLGRLLEEFWEVLEASGADFGSILGRFLCIWSTINENKKNLGKPMVFPWFSWFWVGSGAKKFQKIDDNLIQSGQESQKLD